MDDEWVRILKLVCDIKCGMIYIYICICETYLYKFIIIVVIVTKLGGLEWDGRTCIHSEHPCINLCRR